MKSEIIKTKIVVVFCLIIGAFSLLIYTETFGNKNTYPGIWLLNTVMAFCMFIIQGVKLVILRNK